MIRENGSGRLRFLLLDPFPASREVSSVPCILSREPLPSEFVVD
jgi:hypothetical protein